jgi:DNA-binding SARP family transcriptional activator/tRNA A-37 threonylcarbamoyl transferase component Bud32
MRVYLTGGLRIESAGVLIDHRAFDFPRAQLALAYLVCERGRPVARAEITDLLAESAAPPTDVDDLLARLGDALAAHVPASELRAAPTTVELVLSKETWVDLEAASEAIHEAEGALRAGRAPDAFGPSAVAHHIARRPFLPGEHGPWVAANRERLHGILLRALEARGEVFLWNNETSLAIEAARELVKLEPYRETGHQLLMRALVASGNAAEALRAYERCGQVLREGLGIEPSDQTRGVVESIAASVGRAKPQGQDTVTVRDETLPGGDLVSLLRRALGGDHVVERELSGGMSKVFVANDIALGRRIVVKVLPPDMARMVAADRFAREVRLAARLQHPNIVPVLSAGIVEGGLPYYTMPYVVGESLRAAISAPPPLAIVRVVSILWDVARALAFAHGQGVVHRDIKPENILLAGDAAVVTDFGIAKAVQDTGFSTVEGLSKLTSTGTAPGTPRYMAPEQITADPSMNHRADIYSFGVVAYELLAGRPPFNDRGLRELLLAQLSEKPRDVRELRPDTPAGLATIVMKCLEKAPEARPQSMKDVIAQLERSRSDQSRVRGFFELMGLRPREG